MKDIINQLKGLALYAAKALMAAATPIITLFVTDALDILAGSAETILAAAATAITVYLTPNRSTRS